MIRMAAGRALIRRRLQHRPASCDAASRIGEKAQDIVFASALSPEFCVGPYRALGKFANKICLAGAEPVPTRRGPNALSCRSPPFFDCMDSLRGRHPISAAIIAGRRAGALMVYQNLGAWRRPISRQRQPSARRTGPGQCGRDRLLQTVKMAGLPETALAPTNGTYSPRASDFTQPASNSMGANP